MKMTPTALAGLYFVELDQKVDERGWFAEAWNAGILEKKNLERRIDQVNFSTSEKKGTFRGYHYQAAPAGQTKVVFCVRGCVNDVAIDIRRGSRTYLQGLQLRLTPEAGLGLYIPPGFAHGYLSLEDDSQIVYLVNGPWSPSHERGVRYNDPALPFKLPGVEVVGKRDRAWPLVTRDA